MICIYGLKDPLRYGIKGAIVDCRNAGITVRMCTGDNLHTAKAIAKDAGFFDDDIDYEKANEFVCMTGQEFERKVVGSTTIVDEKDPEKTK